MVWVLLPLLVACGRETPRPRPQPAASAPAPSASSAPTPSRPPSAETSSARAPSAVPPNAAETPLVIVWGTSPAGVQESFLLERTGEDVEVRGKKGGALVFAGGGVYRWRETVGTGHGLKDCDEAFNPGEKPRPNNRFTFEVKGAKAERLDAPGELEVEPIRELEDMAVYSNTVTFEGSLGPYLFISSNEDARHCLAAHDGGSMTYWVFDLEKRAAPSPPFPSKDDEALLRAAARDLPAAETKPCADAVRASGSTDPPTLDSMSLESVVPTWSKNGAFRFELTFTIMLSYVGGRHDCIVQVSRTPPSLERLKPPAWLTPLPKKLEGLELKGWSGIPTGDPASVEGVNRVFKVRPKADASP